MVQGPRARPAPSGLTVQSVFHEPEVHMQILSRPELLAPVRAMTNAMAARVGLNDIDACHLALALDEALTNIIRHGYDSDRNGRIWIEMGPLALTQGLRIEIKDRARSVNPDELQGRDLEDIRPGGLGMHLMRTLVDRFEHANRPDGGMQIVLEKSSTPASVSNAS